MANQISAFLIDIDGVLVTDNQRISGAQEALDYLMLHEIPFQLVTNTTRKSQVIIWNHLKKQGFNLERSRILTATMAGVNWLKNKDVERIHLLLSGSAVNDFKDFKITTAAPEYVVIGDIGQNLTFDRINTAFQLIMKGAKILALQKNRYWQTAKGLALDAGAFVAALEYATKKRAVLIGKPQKQFFLQGADLLNYSPQNIAVIGDDIDTDIRGAQKAGMFGILMKTGKFREEVFNRSQVKPDVVLGSIKELPQFIEQIKGESK
jgi:HAD superfamily hydrolase (TIGR01458 family)